MARPRILRTKDGGEISLKNCAPETYDKVKAVLDGETPATPAASAATAVNGDLTHTAFGTAKVGGQWAVAILKYNPETNEAVVERLERGGEEKHITIANFKALVVQHGLL
jgi:hypothetical protein